MNKTNKLILLWKNEHTVNISKMSDDAVFLVSQIGGFFYFLF